MELLNSATTEGRAANDKAQIGRWNLRIWHEDAPEGELFRDVVAWGSGNPNGSIWLMFPDGRQVGFARWSRFETSQGDG